MVVLLPRIALPAKETRALFAAALVAVRARTARFWVDVLVLPDAVVERETTLRDDVAVLPRAVVVRAELFVVARDVTERDGVVFEVFATLVVRDTVARDVFVARDVVVFRGLARPVVVAAARGDWAVVGITVGATGSANTARIDNNVEHTKNAPASKNTVPTAFLQ